jgi:hypothetical protein
MLKNNSGFGQRLCFQAVDPPAGGMVTVFAGRDETLVDPALDVFAAIEAEGLRLF